MRWIISLRDRFRASTVIKAWNAMLGIFVQSGIAIRAGVMVLLHTSIQTNPLSFIIKNAIRLRILFRTKVIGDVGLGAKIRLLVRIPFGIAQSGLSIAAKVAIRIAIMTKCRTGLSVALTISRFVCGRILRIRSGIAFGAKTAAFRMLFVISQLRDVRIADQIIENYFPYQIKELFDMKIMEKFSRRIAMPSFCIGAGAQFRIEEVVP